MRFEESWGLDFNLAELTKFIDQLAGRILKIVIPSNILCSKIVCIFELFDLTWSRLRHNIHGGYPTIDWVQYKNILREDKFHSTHNFSLLLEDIHYFAKWSLCFLVNHFKVDFVVVECTIAMPALNEEESLKLFWDYFSSVFGALAELYSAFVVFFLSIFSGGLYFL